MAQPVFEEHPLQDYFRGAFLLAASDRIGFDDGSTDSGEDTDIMPGGDFEFAMEQPTPYPHKLGSSWLFSAAVQLLQLVRSKSHTSQQTNAFAERFKYNVISSSLLSSEVALTQTTHHRSFSPHIPGRLASSSYDNPTLDGESSYTSPVFDSFTDSHWPLTLTCMAAVAFVTGNFVLFMLLASTTLVFCHVSTIEKSVKPEVVAASFDTLDELITAGNVWDSAVGEAITILENDERSIFYGPTSAASPATSLRVALQSSLHTTQTQCDNVRQLFSALTSPAELAPLSEMYAPPTPIKTSFDPHTVRPKSLPGIRPRTVSISSNKRATWNGSYATLAQAGSPTMQIFKRREKRRSDLSGLLGTATNAVRSAPVTPGLEGLKEEDESVAGSEPAYLTDDDTFGAAALDFRRKHRYAGLETLRQSDYSTQTVSSSSRFTLMHTSRHPLSLSALNLALQGALAAKRYACSHLLALRFDEEEEYWEDVRSVMALLTSTLVDASSRLMEALDEADRMRIKDEIPSSASESLSRETSIEPSSPLVTHVRSSSWSSRAKDKEGDQKRFRTVEQMVSFAPMPTHLARFAAHVDACSSALNDARDNIEQCVFSLREARTNDAPSTELPYLNDCAPQDTAIEAYDRVRKELGLALRECERGREQLLEVINTNRGRDGEGEDVEDDSDSDDVPALGHDTGTDESEDRIPESISTLLHPTSFLAATTADTGVGEDETHLDDATAHLLLTASSHHLPPIGAEQVFEAETASESGISFTRERSKLTRDERIELAKARRAKRESTRSHHHPEDDGEGAPVDRFRRGLGPGGEVVQELKDVIWKVGERRRKMAEQLLLSPSSPSSLSEVTTAAPRRIPSPFTRLDS